MQQQVIELLRHHHQHVSQCELGLPCFEVRIKLLVFLAAVVPADCELSVPVDDGGLLLNKVLGWNDEDSLQMSYFD